MKIFNDERIMLDNICTAYKKYDNIEYDIDLENYI